MINGFRENTDNPMDDNPIWNRFEENYNKYYLEYKGDRTPKIPKNIHFIWLGSPFPKEYERLKEMWVKHHPDWNIKVWDDDDAENFGMINKKSYDSIKSWGAKSDIFRCEILYRHGGIYVDTDFECLKPFDDLLYLNFFAGGGWNAWPMLFNGLLACRPGDEFIGSIIQAIQQKQINAVNSYHQIMDFAGPGLFTEQYFEYIKTTTDKTVIFPNRFFYPLPAVIRMEVREDNEASRKIVDSYIKSNSYCVHLWYCSWQK